MDPLTKDGYLGNVAFFQMLFKNKGDRHHGHAHSYDHPTFVCRGAILAIVNGQETRFVEDDVIAIAYGVEHELVAEADNTMVLCVHAYHDRQDPRGVVDARSIPAGVHPSSFAVPLLIDDARAVIADFEALRSGQRKG